MIKYLLVHLRNENFALLESIDEVIEIAEKVKVKLMISHLKSFGEENWGNIKHVLKRMADARTRGVDVWADSYFYPYTITTILHFMPKWALEGSLKSIRERLNNPEEKAKITKFLIEERGQILRLYIHSV